MTSPVAPPFASRKTRRGTPADRCRRAGSSRTISTQEKVLSTCEMLPRKGSRSISPGGTMPKASASGGRTPRASARKVRFAARRRAHSPPPRADRGGRGNWRMDSCAARAACLPVEKIVEEPDELRRLNLKGAGLIVDGVRATECVEKDHPARRAEEEKRKRPRRRGRDGAHATASVSRASTTASPPAKLSPAMSISDSLAVPLWNSIHVRRGEQQRPAQPRRQSAERARPSQAKRIHGA